ncbi:MAG: hypothetical protein EA402_14590 [Planctomycetota bacterium]|nr:MAG: hypothetical protein EA402_14590 [Planctomycetota bacterium]
MNGFLRNCLWAIAVATLLAGCGNERPPPLQAVGPPVQKQDIAWPQPPGDFAWRAQGRLRLDLREGSIAGTAHLLGMANNSLRVVLLADGGVVIDDILLTSRDRRLPDHQGPLKRIAPALRHALLQMREDSAEWRGGILTAQAREDASTRFYGGDPLALRRIEGPWGWVTVGDYRLRENLLVPHHLQGIAGPLRWNLQVSEWHRNQ